MKTGARRETSQKSSLTSLSRLWARWKTQSKKIASPIHIKGIAADYGFSVEDVRQVFAELTIDHTKIKLESLRAYARGGLNHALVDKMSRTPPTRGESLQSWGTRVSGSTQYGFVVNGAERWNDALCRKVAHFLSPLSAYLRLPYYTFELVLFVGNYGYTPFGVHLDEANLGVIHLHLGPNPKIMTLWKPRHYRAITGSNYPCYEPQRLVDRGSSFTIESGDLFLLPPGYFHVGMTRNFSTDIAVLIRRVPTQIVLERALGCAVPRLIALNGDKKTASAESCIDSIRSRIDIRMGDWLESSLERYNSAMISLGGFASEPVDRAVSVRRWQTRFVIVTEPFRLYPHRQGKILRVYVRGREVTLPAHSGLERMVRILNKGAAVSVKELIRELSDQIETRVVLHILRIFYRYHGIELTKNRRRRQNTL